MMQELVPGLKVGAAKSSATGRLSLNLLYIGANDGTSRHRFLALQRCGHVVDLVDPHIDIKGVNWFGPLASKYGFLGFEAWINRHVLTAIGKKHFDVIWVDGGRAIGKNLALELKKRCRFLIVHNLDNPFVEEDVMRWRLLLDALPVYDLFATPRSSSRAAALARGVKRAAVVWQAADEIVHRHRDLTEGERRAFSSDVVFVGTWMRGRGSFMKGLMDRGVSLRIFGPRWEKAPEYSSLGRCVTTGMQNDVSYVKAISGAKVALCLLNFDNEDLHTTRSLEIPAIGTVLCAPHTRDHELLYSDGTEACFFKNADECADLCLSLLRDDERRRAMASAGHARALKNGRFNEAMVGEILAAVLNG